MDPVKHEKVAWPYLVALDDLGLRSNLQNVLKWHLTQEDSEYFAPVVAIDFPDINSKDCKHVKLTLAMSREHRDTLSKERAPDQLRTIVFNSIPTKSGQQAQYTWFKRDGTQSTQPMERLVDLILPLEAFEPRCVERQALMVIKEEKLLPFSDNTALDARINQNFAVRDPFFSCRDTSQSSETIMQNFTMVPW
jgi:hypothetical protein